MLARATGTHFFWITSRAAGTAALLLASLSVCIGLAMGGRLFPHGTRDPRTTHEALSLATMAALVVHALSLLGDSYLRPSLADVTLPLVSSYRQPWMTIGILAGWLTILLGLSYYLRGRIGVQRWRKLHRFTALAWLLGLAHALGEGTDAGAAWFIVAVALVVVPAVVLLAGRMLGGMPVARAVERASMNAHKRVPVRRA
jgi:sulfoxide reductase heme-binding subunit YedZ